VACSYVALGIQEEEERRREKERVALRGYL
jgi:hypothetical protein